MFPANLSYMEQTAVIGTRKWGQVLCGRFKDPQKERKKIKTQTDNGPHLTYVAVPRRNLPVFKFSDFHGVF